MNFKILPHSHNIKNVIPAVEIPFSAEIPTPGNTSASQANTTWDLSQLIAGSPAGSELKIKDIHV